MATPSIRNSIGKLALAGEQAGFTVDQMIWMLNAGLSVEGLLWLIEWRLSSLDALSPFSRWIV